MATRPSITVTIRASDSTYTTGVVALQGRPTKIARAGADITEGYKVDSALGTQPVTAQGANYDDNVVDQWAKWTSEGSNADGGDAHIVETDSGGDINVIGVNCADVRVTPNTGTDGIEVTTSGGSKGVEVLQDATSTDHGVNVTSEVGAAAPGFFASTRSNVGMLLSHGSLAGLSIGGTTNGGVIGPNIALTSNTVESNDDTVGTIWNREQNSIKNVKMGMGSSAGWPIIAKNASCYARSASAAHSLTGSVTDQALGSTFSFKTDQVPQDAGLVMVTIWGRITLSSFQDNTVVLRVRDTDAGDATVCELFIYTLEHSGATTNTIRQSATIAQTYQLPAAGSRTFDLVWSGDTTGVSGTFTGFVEIQEVRG